MRVTINECIEHIDLNKIHVSQSREKFHQYTMKPSSCIDLDVMKGVKNSKGFSGMEETDKDIDDICMVRYKNDVALENEIETLSENVKTSAHIDLKHFQNIQDKVNDSATSDTVKETGISSENDEDHSVNGNGIEIIHLKMKDIKQADEDCDDTSWFFDDFEGVDAKSTENDDNTIIDQDEGSNDLGYKKVGNSDKCIVSDDEENSDDSGAIIGDIQNLKSDIENDIRKLQDSREKVGRQKANTTNINMNKDETDSDEFEGCFDNSDHEFDDCFKNSKDSNKTKTDMKEKYSNTGIDFEEEEFMTVALKFNDIEVKGNKSKERSESSPSMFYSRLNEHGSDSKIDQTNRVKGSFNYELQSCSKEYTRVKEILNDNSINYGSVRNEEEQAIKNVMVSNGSKDCSESINKPQSDDKNFVHNNCVEMDEQIKSARTPNSSNHCQKKEGEASHIDQLQKINSILGSLGNKKKNDSSKIKVSSLKFHSRHFQDGDVEEPGDIDNSLPENDTGQLENEAYNVTDVKNISTSRNSTSMNKNFESSSDMCTDFLSDSPRPNKEPVSNVKQNHKCLDENIHNMFKEISDISKRNNSNSRKSLESALPVLNSGNNIDLSQSSISGASKGNLSDSDIFKMNRIKPELDISHVGKELSLKECKTGVVNKPSVFLRSRHMNFESEDNSVLDMSQVVSSDTSKETESKEVTHISINGNKELLDGHSEEMEADTRSLVFGVNYDGDESINKAVCDVIMKQSKDGKLRFVGVYTCFTISADNSL